MGLILKALAGMSALILLVGAVFGSLLAVGGFLLAAIKLLIIAIFIALVVMVIVAMLRDRREQRSEPQDF